MVTNVIIKVRMEKFIVGLWGEVREYLRGNDFFRLSLFVSFNIFVK